MGKLYVVIIRILRRYVCIAEPRESEIVVRQHRHYQLMKQADEVAECYIRKRNVLLRVRENRFWTSCRRQEFTMKRISPTRACSIEL